VGGSEFFTRDYILWHPLYSGIRFDLQATTLTLSSWIQNQEASSDCRGLLLCQVTSHSDQGFSFYCVLTYTPRHTHVLRQSDRCIRITVLPQTDHASSFVSQKVLAKARGMLDLWRFSSHLVWFDHLCKLWLLWVIPYEPTLWRCWILVLWDIERGWHLSYRNMPHPHVLQCRIWSFYVKRYAFEIKLIEIHRNKRSVSRSALQGHSRSSGLTRIDRKQHIWRYVDSFRHNATTWRTDGRNGITISRCACQRTLTHHNKFPEWWGWWITHKKSENGMVWYCRV